MRLAKIKPTYFRGFGDCDWIDMSSDLVLISGPNGYGKTGIAETIEWLLYGKTRKREKGENLSSRDYQNSYRNIHAPSGIITKVEATLNQADGTSVNLCRELRDNESSEEFIEGTPALFSSLGIVSDALYCPVIAQDNLQDFIHSRPKDRRNKISEMLGIEALIRFKAVLDRTRALIRVQPLVPLESYPTSLYKARIQFDRIIEVMENNEDTDKIAIRWGIDNFSIDSDREELRKIAVKYLGISDEEDFGSIKEKLEVIRQKSINSVFDLSPIETIQHPEAILERCKATKQKVDTEIGSLAKKLDDFFGEAASEYSSVQLQYWQTGLELQPKEELNACPMCEADTLTLAKRKELKQRMEASAGYNAALKKLQEQNILTVNAIKQLSSLLISLFPSFLSTEQRKRLVEIFGGEAANNVPSNPCVIFLEAHDEVQTSVDKMSRDLDDLTTNLQSLDTLATNPQTITKAKELVTSLKVKVTDLYETGEELTSSYKIAYSHFKAFIVDKIIRGTKVKEIDALLAPIKGWKDIRMIYEQSAILKESLELIRKVEEFIQLKQVELLAARGQEVSNWYDMMNPGASVRYDRMEPGTDSLFLWGKSYEADISAVSCFSQCQLNCLGLSFNLTRITSPQTVFNFLVMDDPVQSMDDTHSESLVLNVVKELTENKGLQLIVLSHSQKIIDEIRNEYYDKLPLRLRISDFTQNGPTITLAETLEETLKKAVQYSAGNEGNRRLSVAIVRRCTELLMRETCLHTSSPQPPPVAVASGMVSFFQSCPGVTPQQVQGLRTTINFCNPSPHTQQGWRPPTQPQIIPHIDRLRVMGKTIGLFS
jgi:DNA repair exonuclease SbcCD ATPase subunit